MWAEIDKEFFDLIKEIYAEEIEIRNTVCYFKGRNDALMFPSLREGIYLIWDYSVIKIDLE